MTNKRIVVKELGQRENKGKGFTAWINDGENNFTQWCGNEEDAKKTIQGLTAGDTIIISYTVRDQWKNFTTFEIIKDVEKENEAPAKEYKESEKKKEKERNWATEARKDATNEEAELNSRLRQHYVDSIKEARAIVDAVTIREDDENTHRELLISVFNKLASPRKYAIDDIRRGN